MNEVTVNPHPISHFVSSPWCQNHISGDIAKAIHLEIYQSVMVQHWYVSSVLYKRGLLYRLIALSNISYTCIWSDQMIIIYMISSNTSGAILVILRIGPVGSIGPKCYFKMAFLSFYSPGNILTIHGDMTGVPLLFTADKLWVITFAARTQKWTAPTVLSIIKMNPNL